MELVGPVLEVKQVPINWQAITATPSNRVIVVCSSIDGMEADEGVTLYRQHRGGRRAERRKQHSVNRQHNIASVEARKKGGSTSIRTPAA